MNQFETPNFEVLVYLGDDKSEKLNKLKKYLDYSLSITIKKQIGEISFDDEKLYAKELLNHYLKGDMHSFTSKNNIRNNIYEIGNANLINLFLMAMIERHAYNVLVKNMQGSSKYRDQCANYITNRISKNHYSDIIEWLTNDFENIEEIIDNYIDLLYKSTEEEFLMLKEITSKKQDTALAMNQLILKVA